MTIPITFPVYISTEEHLYFTRETLKSAVSEEHKLVIILVENYVKPKLRESFNKIVDDFDAILLSNPYGNNVSAAWNIGIRHAIDALSADYVLIPNNDIIMHPKCIDNLVKFWQDTQDKYIMWTALAHSPLGTLNQKELGDSHDNHPGFSFFAVSKEGIEKLKQAEQGTFEPEPGFFDPGYKCAYFEDQDYHQRILRAGFDGGKTASAIYHHFGSRTISVDKRLKNRNGMTYEDNRQYFKRKWGYDSHGRGWSNQERIETGYKTAFNK